MKGLGDNILHRPYVWTLCQKFEEVYLNTPWPHVYWDMPDNLNFVKSTTKLRTQAKNVRRECEGFPSNIPHPNITYTSGYNLKRKENIFSVLDAKLPRIGFHFHMDPPREWGEDLPFDPLLPFCLVRNTTIRKEWCVPNRNCRNEYLQLAAKRLKESLGITVIEIADIDGEEETLVGGPIEVADIRLVKGELTNPQLLWGFSRAAAVIGCHGFSTPLSLMTNANALIIHGGYDLPQWFVHSQMSAPQVKSLTPDIPCGCFSRHHDCSLDISRSRLNRAINTLLANTETRLCTLS
jgi:hypothetical protein